MNSVLCTVEDSEYVNLYKIKQHNNCVLHGKPSGNIYVQGGPIKTAPCKDTFVLILDVFNLFLKTFSVISLHALIVRFFCKYVQCLDNHRV